MSVNDDDVSAQAFTDASIAFQTKMVANGGLGQETYLPEGACSTWLLLQYLCATLMAETQKCTKVSNSMVSLHSKGSWHREALLPVASAAQQSP